MLPIVALVLGSASSAKASASKRAAPLPPPDVNAAITAAASKHGVSPRLLRALAYVESRYDVGARSARGALGVFQFMPATADALGIDPLDTDEAAKAAAFYLRRLRARHGSWDAALAAYNWGTGNVARSPARNDWPASVRRYVLAVQRAIG